MIYYLFTRWSPIHSCYDRSLLKYRSECVIFPYCLISFAKLAFVHLIFFLLRIHQICIEHWFLRGWTRGSKSISSSKAHLDYIKRLLSIFFPSHINTILRKMINGIDTGHKEWFDYIEETTTRPWTFFSLLVWPQIQRSPLARFHKYLHCLGHTLGNALVFISLPFWEIIEKEAISHLAKIKIAITMMHSHLWAIIHIFWFL